MAQRKIPASQPLPPGHRSPAPQQPGSFTKPAAPSSVGSMKSPQSPRRVSFAPVEVERPPQRPSTLIVQRTPSLMADVAALPAHKRGVPPRPPPASPPLPDTGPLGQADLTALGGVALDVLSILNRKWARTDVGDPTDISMKWSASEKEQLLAHIPRLCVGAKRVLKVQDYPLLTIQSPVVVLGDLHGRFDDLKFFLKELYDPKRSAEAATPPEGSEQRIADNVLLLSDDAEPEVAGIWEVPDATEEPQPSRRVVSEFQYPGRKSMTCNRLLFLGDFVDRGFASLEVALYVLALKVLDPDNVNVIRGNHESEDVNDDYGFKEQCERLFGEVNGAKVWQQVNRVFDDFPLAAVLDGKIFCAHGGIPRLGHNRKDDRLAVLRMAPLWREFRDSPCQATALQDPKFRRVAEIYEDLLWSDPADEMYEDEMNAEGFGPSLRGTSVMYGTKAVDDFLRHNGFVRIMRAHQMKTCGFNVSKNGKVVTVFSSSHYSSDEDNFAGVAYVTPETIRAVTRM